MKPAVLILLAFLVGVGGYLAFHSWPPSLGKSANLLPLQSESNCFLQQQACLATAGQAQVHLRLAPQPVPLMKPIQAFLQVKGLNDLETITLKVDGLNMYMGFQEVQLSKQTDTEWEGSFSLPICSETEMHWRVTATLKTKQQGYQADFNLVTQR